MRKPPPTRAQVLHSAEQALRLVLLVAQRGSITLSEAATELGVVPSTAHRLLATCKHVGFAAQDRPGGPYSPGPAVQELALATSATVDLRDAARPVLERLAADCGETTNLMLLEGDRVRFVESLEGSHPVRVGSRLGVVLPAHCTSGGKAMLAALPPDELLRRYPTHELDAVSGHPPMSWPALIADLRLIRERGWAVNLGDSDPSIGGVGVALRSASGYPIAAVTAGAPLSRLATEAQAAALVPALLDARDRIQRRLRGRD
jgi:DNA-binding IclR family transcriptional regulator